MKHCTHCR